VPRNTLLILYRSYILPLLDYGDVNYDNISTADSCRLENVQTMAAILLLGCMQTTSLSKILNELSMSPLHLRRNCHILIAFHKILLGPCTTFLATLTSKLFRDLSNHSLRHVINVQLPSCRTALFHSSFFLKVSRLWNSLPTSVQSLGRNLFRSKAEPDWKVGGPREIFTGGPLWCISWRHRLYNLCFRWFATFSFPFSSSRLCACL